MKKHYNFIIGTLVVCAPQIFLMGRIVNKYEEEKVNLQQEIYESSKENFDLIQLNKELRLENNSINEHNLVLTKELEEGSFKSKVSFNCENITEPSNVTYEQLKYALKDTKLHKYSEVFVEVEEKYSINSLFMVGIVANESAWLKSGRVLNQNNVTGYAVYSDSSKGRDFNSIEECILETARLLNEEYVNKEGKHYNGLSVSDINKKYSSATDWDSIVISIANNTRDKINKFQEYLY